MRPATNGRTLINDQPAARSGHNLLARVTLFLAGVIVFALLFILRFALGLLDSVNQELQFRIRFCEWRSNSGSNRSNSLSSTPVKVRNCFGFRANFV